MVQKVGDVNYTRIVTHNALRHQKNIWKKKTFGPVCISKLLYPMKHQRSTYGSIIEFLCFIALVLHAGLPWSMPNANQCQSILINILALITMPINSSQFQSLPINSGSRVLWLELISFERYVFQINSMILIGIEHWLRESCTCKASGVKNV